MRKKFIFSAIFFVSFVFLIYCGQKLQSQNNNKTGSYMQHNAKPDSFEITRTETEWESCLTPEQFRVLREKGTELPFTGKYYHFDKKGTYVCAACGNHLFSSDRKFDSGTGWPSFWDVFDKGSVVVENDSSHGMFRIEVNCAKCGSHLGHVFEDGPAPTGLRYCINSLSLDFKEAETK
jgi:peptide-methionine (R)-S-oxide reductase